MKKDYSKMSKSELIEYINHLNDVIQKQSDIIKWLMHEMRSGKKLVEVKNTKKH